MTADFQTHPTSEPGCVAPLALRKPYQLFVGDIDYKPHAKTAFGIRDWAPDDCAAQIRLPGCSLDLGLPECDPKTAARDYGARSLVLGAAAPGGEIPSHWLPTLLAAIAAGMDVVAGMHTRLMDIPELAAAASTAGVRLIDVRVPPAGLRVATGRKRTGMRLHTVGTDCALGKKYTALTLTAAFKSRGVAADFRATGQTGILIAGGGIPIDSVVADFVAGAAEALSPDAAPDHWDVIEGQGALFHPSYAAVTLGLLHGSQPDALVICHDPSRRHIVTCEHAIIPPLDEVACRYLEAARLTNPRVEVVGVSLNTSNLTAEQASNEMADAEDLLGVPCFDPLVTPPDAVIDRALAL